MLRNWIHELLFARLLSSDRKARQRADRRRGFRHLRGINAPEVLEDRTLLAADFGDAPTPYPVTLAEDGARHDAGGQRLGSLWGANADGVHSPNADADFPDEDGVTFGILYPGQTNGQIIVNASGTTQLDAWIDFDGDNVWETGDEQIADNLTLVGGNNTLTFNVPAGTPVGTTFARFRVSTAGNLDPTGLATTGEVEDYSVEILSIADGSTPRDFGDAPEFYPVTFAEDGAQHGATGPTLGTNRDSETVGIHSAAADNDDLTGSPDDEDGIAFGTIQVGALGAQVTVNVQNAPAGARVDGWIDFNQDGNWGGPGERIADSVLVANGNNVLMFDVPATAEAGTTFARFRISTSTDVGIGGFIPEGEVEDHVVTIVAPTASEGLFSGERVVSSSVNEVREVTVADLDGDGDLDMLASPKGSDSVFWYENDGSQNFTQQLVGIIDPPPLNTRAALLRVADLDGDGDQDVLGWSFYDPFRIFWFENDGSQNFTQRSIFSHAHSTVTDIEVVDFDGDGDQDVVAPYIDQIPAIDEYNTVWFENDGSENFTERTISSPAFGKISSVDMDGDGDLDIVQVYRDNGVWLVWRENEGNGTFKLNVVTNIYPATSGARFIETADIDQDGDIDILINGATDSIRWYENNGSQSFTEHIIDDSELRPTSIVIADINGDGDFDLVLATHPPSRLLPTDTIFVYDNDGSQNFGKRIVQGNSNGSEDVRVGDVDGDGDLDLITASESDDKIVWYENIDGEDFGDAPEPYPTLLAENGARHLETGPRLGAERDIEGDGVHSVGADADDLTFVPDDEDGVVFGAMTVGALDAQVTVTVQDAPAGAMLDAWVDFNGDGNWGGPNEQIAASLAVVNGANIVMFDVPASAVPGTSYARFRLSTAGGLGFVGGAADGEVEDYVITIGPALMSSSLFDTEEVITSTVDAPVSVATADLDGDGDLDALSTSLTDDTIAWYENDGSENFTKHVVGTNSDGPYTVQPIDMDGDGDLDLVTSSQYDNKIAWYENDGSQNFTLRTVSTASNAPRSAVAFDMDGDGDIDIASASRNDDTIAWYENDGSQNFTRHIVSTTADSARSVFAADVDSDGDMDLLSASFDDDTIAWYENDGSQNFTKHTISTNADMARRVIAVDVDGDGDTDVVSSSQGDDKVAWYENDGSQNFTAHTVSTAAGAPIGIAVSDIDGDGDQDVVAAAFSDNAIYGFFNDGSQNFAPLVVGTSAAGAFGVAVGDVDGDGRLDLLSAQFNDDEIAWYTNIDGEDFGDAPTPYPVTLAEDGPRHATTGPQLGAARDDELDGVHSASADADDLTGVPDDEDGVTFGAMQVGALGATVTVNVQGAAGNLDAWIDFNGDGSWGGPGEQIFDTQSLGVGDNVLSFDVPNYALAGTTYARFRLSTVGDLGVGGLSADGEVEDYVVTIVSPTAASGLFSGGNEIDPASDSARSVFPADIDGDGDMDVFSAARFDDTISWHENDGSQNFTAHTISTTADRPAGLFATDVDGDGDIDAVNASSGGDAIVWYENDGSQNFTAHTMSTVPDGAESVFAVDLDGDGDIDVLSASINDDRIAWYENDGSQNFIAHTITTSADFALSVFAADVDGDGDMDVLSASTADDKIAWYENDGSQNFTAHTISTFADGARSVFAADVDGDGDTDILSAAGDFFGQVAWYENDGSANFTTHTITTAARGAASVFAADIDGDGDIDVVVFAGLDEKHTWYQNDGSQNFTEHTISTVGSGAAMAADIDGDGDLDVLTATNTWYENGATLDFGDAPSPYPVTFAEDGARHDPRGPTLGTERDSEADGTHSTGADADDLTGGPDDEDGVDFDVLTAGEMGHQIDVAVRNATVATYLDAWIDFDGDGVWEPSEKIADVQLVANGDFNAVVFDVPADAIPGYTYARFRISTAGPLDLLSHDPTGPADDGEVEDHRVRIQKANGATYQVNGSQLTVRGTALPDDILVQNNGGVVEIVDGGTVINTGVNLASLTSIRVLGNDGADFLTLDPSLGAITGFLFGERGDDTLTGGDGGDVINGGTGNDILLGGAGDDALSGLDGVDSYDGGADDDRLAVDADDTSFQGGSGKDTLDATAAASGITLDMVATGLEVFFGSAFDDIVTAAGSAVAVEIRGNGGNDILTGGNAGDLMFGGDGVDTLTGNDGNDYQNGGTGADNYDAGNHDDRIDFEAGDASIQAGAGEDTGSAAASASPINLNMITTGFERIIGSEFNDIVTAAGATFSVRIDGRGGNDTITGGNGVLENILTGGPGDDTITGGTGEDIANGGPGADSINTGDAPDRIDFDENDTSIQGGAGTDLGFATAAGTGVNIDMVAMGIEVFYGSPFADIVTAAGATVPVQINGEDGNDDLTGGNLADVLRGGNDNDTLAGGPDDDAMLGQAGADTFVIQDNDSTDFNAGEGDVIV